MPPLSEIPSRAGRGAALTSAVRAGRPITTWSAPLVPASSLSPDDAAHSLLVTNGWSMPPFHDANDLVNHSCAPNAGLRFTLLDRTAPWAAIDLVALRDLPAGEEITIDYASVLCDERFSFPCHCAAPTCRGAVKTWTAVAPGVRESLLRAGLVSPTVLRTFTPTDLRPFADPDPRGVRARRLLVTGATGGIGRELVRALARAGARSVAFTYHAQKEKALDLVREIEKLGVRALALQADNASESSIRDAVADAAAAFTGLDGLACVAGAPFNLDEWNRDLAAVDRAFCEQVFRVDTLGSLTAIQAAAPALIASTSGRVVLFASTPALMGDTVGHPYTLAKAAIVALGKSAAQELGPHGIHVNTLALGHIETQAMDSLSSAQAAELRNGVALRRGGRPEEVATKALFLLGQECEFMTGTTMVVDGGYPRKE